MTATHPWSAGPRRLNTQAGAAGPSPWGPPSCPPPSLPGSCSGVGLGDIRGGVAAKPAVAASSLWPPRFPGNPGLGAGVFGGQSFQL